MKLICNLPHTHILHLLKIAPQLDALLGFQACWLLHEEDVSHNCPLDFQPLKPGREWSYRLFNEYYLVRATLLYRPALVWEKHELRQGLYNVTCALMGPGQEFCKYSINYPTVEAAIEGLQVANFTQWGVLEFPMLDGFIPSEVFWQNKPYVNLLDKSR